MGVVSRLFNKLIVYKLSPYLKNISEIKLILLDFIYKTFRDFGIEKSVSILSI
jgi:phosphorylcholine metabolism protein LicD